MRWVKAAFCGVGIFIGIAAGNAAECPGKRDSIENRHGTAVGGTKHVRPGCSQKIRIQAAERQSNRHKAERKAERKVERKVERKTDRKIVHKADRSGTRKSHKPAADKTPVPKSGGTYSVGIPYQIAGRTYTPQADPDYSAEGKASWYGGEFHGRRTANGERFDAHTISAAHPTLPLPSYVRVTNLENHRSLVVRLNDRGPYHGHRLIDVSMQAAKLLGFYDQGLAQVRVEYIGRAELKESGDAKLAATLRQEDARTIQVAVTAPIRPDTASPDTSEDRAATPTQCIRPPVNSRYPQPANFKDERTEDLNCRPAMPETKMAAFLPSATHGQKAYCVAELPLNRP